MMLALLYALPRNDMDKDKEIKRLQAINKELMVVIMKLSRLFVVNTN